MAELAVDAAAFRKALGSFATGVTIVTTHADGADVGVTANSFNSVSLDPPLVLWSLAKSSGSLAPFTGASGFAVHILAWDQQELSNRFARKGADKFAGLPRTSGRDGIPLLAGCAARFECRTTYRYEGGDHIIFVGEVTDFSHGDKEPLLFHAGRYALASRDEGPGSGPGLVASLQSDSLTFLIASSYFHLLSPVRRRAAEAGLSLSDHYALTVLVARGECALAEINDAIGHLGLATDAQGMSDLAARDLVAVRDDAARGSVISLTDSGRQLVIELIATAKAREVDAQLHLDDADVRLLRRLLRRFVGGLVDQDEGAGVSRHMALMRAVTEGGTGLAASTAGPS